MKLINYLRTILKHKYYVFIYCFKLRIPWRGLIHDLSKFNPKELFVSAKYYNKKISPITKEKLENQYSKAWLHHKGINSHHVEYWLDITSGGLYCIKPDWNDILEMCADWLSATKVYDNGDLSKSVKYWNSRLDKKFMHPSVEEVFNKFYLHLNIFNDINKSIKYLKNNKIAYEKDSRDRSSRVL